jgi:glycosyltransferase involved in cell wall biosynthesis
MAILSVIIATYNRSPDLKLALESLQKQDLQKACDYEVLIMDNNSNDDTKAVVESFKTAFEGKLKYFFEPKQGKSFAVNRGIIEAKGDIVVLTDDDCVFESHYLLNIHQTFEEAGPQVGFIGGKTAPRWDNCQKPDWFDRLEPDWFKEYFWGPLAILDYGDQKFVIDSRQVEAVGKKLFYGANMAVRRDLFLKYGDLNVAKPVAEDTELQLRLLKAGINGLYAPGIKVFHKVTAGRLKPSYYYRWYFSRGIHREILESYPKKFYHLLGIQLHFIAETARFAWDSFFERSYTVKMHKRFKVFFNLGQMVQIAKMHLV